MIMMIIITRIKWNIKNNNDKDNIDNIQANNWITNDINTDHRVNNGKA